MSIARKLQRARLIRVRGGQIEVAVGVILATLLETQSAAAAPVGAPAPALPAIDIDAIRTMSVDELRALLTEEQLIQLGIDVQAFETLLETDVVGAIRMLDAAFREKLAAVAGGGHAVAGAASHLDDAGQDGDANADDAGADGGSGWLGGVSPLLLLAGLGVIGGGIALIASGDDDDDAPVPPPTPTPPVATADTVQTAEDTAVTFDVRTNDTASAGATLTVTQINGTAITTTTPVAVTGGSVSLNANGTLTFTPTANFNGTPSFTYTVTDGRGGTATGNVGLNVTPVNDAPVNTVPGAIAGAAGAAITITGLGVADVDAGDTITTTLSVGSGVLSVGQVQGGAAVQGAGTGTVTLTGTAAQVDATLKAIGYTGAPGFFGTDTLTIRSSDGTATDVDTVTLTVARVLSGVVIDGYVAGATVFVDVNGNGIRDEGEPSAATAQDGSFTLQTNAVGRIIATGGVNTDTGLPNTLDLIAPIGSGVISPLTTIVSGLIDAGLTLAQANAAVASALGLPAGVDLTNFDPLAPQNAGADSLAVQKAVAQVASLLTLAETAGGAGVESAVVTKLVAAAQAGTLDLTNTASITAVLSDVPGLPADQVATVAVKAASVNQAIANAETIEQIADTVQETLTPGANLPPATVADTVTVLEDGTITFDPRANDIDPEGGALSIQSINGQAFVDGEVTVEGLGLFRLAQNGSIVFVSAANINGARSVTYTVADAAGNVGTGTINLNITPVNDAPTAGASSVTTGIGAPIVLPVTASDIDGDALNVTAINGTAIAAGGSVALESGVVTLNDAGQLVFTPAAGFVGTPTIEFTISDPSGASANGSVAVTVQPTGPVLSVLPADFGAVVGAAGSLAAAGISTFDIVGDTLNITEAQAAAMIDAGLEFADGDVVTVAADGTQLSTSLKSLQDLHVASVAISGGATTLSVDAGAGGLAGLSVGDLPQFDVAQGDGALDVTLNLSGAIDPTLDLSSIAGALREAGIDHLGGASVNLTLAQATAIGAAGLDFTEASGVTVGVTGDALSTLDVAALGAINTDIVDVDGDIATITEAQAAAMIDAGLEFADGDVVTVAADGTQLSTSLKSLQDLHVASVAVAGGGATLSVDAGAGGLAGLSVGDLPQFDVAQSDVALDVTLNLSGAIDPTLDLSSLAGALREAGIDHLGGTNVDLTLAQATAIEAAGLDFTDASDVSVAFGAGEAAGLFGNLDALSNANVDSVDVIGDVLTISDAQASAMIDAGIDFVAADDITVEAAGTQMSTTLKGLHDLHVDAVAVQMGVSKLTIDAGSLAGIGADDLPQFDTAQSDDDLDLTLVVNPEDMDELVRLSTALRDAGIDHVTIAGGDLNDPALAAAMAEVTSLSGIDFVTADNELGGVAISSFGAMDMLGGLSETALYGELMSALEQGTLDDTGQPVQVTDAMASSLLEAGMLKAYLAETLLVDATQSGDLLASTLKSLADVGADQVTLAQQGDKPVYVSLGVDGDAASVGEIRELFEALSDDGAFHTLFAGNEHVALVLDAGAANALASIDGALQHLADLGFTEVDILSDGTAAVAALPEDAAVEVKVIGQDDDLYDYLHHGK